MRYLIKNGSIIDPASRIATLGNILIDHGKVVQVMDMTDLSSMIEPTGDDIEIINARRCIIAPGFIDLHTHLREPGNEHEETIASGTAAAARGGFTTLCAMPDTTPAVDTAGIVRQIIEMARRQGVVQIEPVGAITMGREGLKLTEMVQLVEAGCVAFSDSPRPVADATVMRNALAYAAMLDVPILSHCEERSLSRGWAMHEGATSIRLGLPGYPAAAEEIAIARDISLTEMAGAHIHICHVSTAGGVALIRAAKERGVRVTAEVTPHHLTLNDQWVLGELGKGQPITPPRRRRIKKADPGLGLSTWLDPLQLPPYDARTRVNPPLRGQEDVEAVIEGLRDGTIDAIATAHSPHSIVETDREYGLATPGISSLETALPLALSLVHRGELDLVTLVAKFTEGPASVLGRTPATLRPGSWADITIFDPDEQWTVDTNEFISKGKNSPIHGQKLKGRIMLTMSGGHIVFRRGSFGAATGSLEQKATKLEGILEDQP